MIVTCN